MSQTACPTIETLSAFALGELPEPELSAVAEHLDCCAECSEQAARLDGATDPFVSELKRVPELGPDTECAATEVVGATATAAEAPTPSIESWGEFRIVREIVRGGMGVVCEAFQGSLNRHVALKFLPELGNLARFRREARAAGRLHHTNIVPVFGVGEQEGRHFYVMQYIAGRGLDAVLKERALPTGVEKTGIEPARVSAGVVARLFPPLRRGGQGGWSPRGGAGDRNDGCAVGLDGREAARIGVQVADALAYAHAQGVIARICDLASPGLEGPTLRGDHLREIRFSPDGTIVGPGDAGGMARLWNAVTGRPVASLPAAGYELLGAAFSPDGRLIMRFGFSPTAEIWDVQSGRPWGAPLRHRGRVNAASFSPDGRLILTASNDGTAQLWDVATCRPTGAPLRHTA